MLDKGTWVRIIVAGGVAVYLIYRTATMNRRIRSSLSEDDRRLFDIAKQANQLRKTDPAAADRLLDEAGRERSAHRVLLRERTPTDRAAAEELLRLASSELDGNRSAAKTFRREAAKDSTMGAMLADMEVVNQRLQADIDLVKRHWPGLGS